MMKHQPVLVEEVMQYLALRKKGIYLDGTVGYGGHAEFILKKLKGDCTYIGLDKDEDALEYSGKRLGQYSNCTLHHASYADAKKILADMGLEHVDGILLDLGASSPQFDRAERGFSLMKEGPLDMRFDISRDLTAADILNTYPREELARIFRQYGEEKYSGKIASAVDLYRRKKKFEKTSQLKILIEQVIPRRFWQRNIHPATRVFQALRIEVNDELNELEKALPVLVNLLKKEGRIAVISFHSLEDRIVKKFFRLAEKECVCPKEFPVCRCDKQKMVSIITKKPIKPSKTEIKNNVRSRSAKLRVAERF